MGRAASAADLTAGASSSAVLVPESSPVEIDSAAAAAAAEPRDQQQQREEECVSPLARFQIDCAEAILFVHEALRLTGSKDLTASNMSDVYLVIAEVVHQLQVKLRTTADPAEMTREIHAAKVGVFDSWMQSTTVFAIRWYVD
jgi:hypothetical protein